MSDQSGATGDDYEDMAGMLGEEMQRLDDEANAILNSIRNETAASGSDDDAADHYDDDDSRDDFDPSEMEDEMNDEILKLDTVTANLRQDLDEVSVESMTSAMSNRDPGVYRQSHRALALEDAAQLLRKKQLYGPGVGGSDRNNPLLVVTVLIWSVLLLLVFHVRYGAMDESGSLSSMPQILHNLIERFVRAA
jgi:hypothetical protein